MKILASPSFAPCMYSVTFEANEAEFTAALDAAYEARKTSFTVEGYEKGSAPRAAIEAQEGAEVFYFDAINLLLAREGDALLEQALADAGVAPVTAPAFNVSGCGHDGFEMMVTIGVMPEVTLGAYKGLTFTYPAMPMPAGMVDAQLAAVQQKVAGEKGELPPLDDDFAQQVSDCETLAELRGKIEESLTKFAERQSRQQGQFLFLEQIGLSSKIELPQYLLQREYENGMENLTEHLKQNGVPFETYLAQQGKSKEQFEQESHDGAAKALRAKLAAYAISAAEGLTIHEMEMENETVRLAAVRKQNINDFKAEHPRYLVKNDLLLSHVIAFLEEHNTLTQAQ